MSSSAIPYPNLATGARTSIFLPAYTLWWREIVRFYRQRARVVGVVASPLIFWIVIGSGFGRSFQSGGAGGSHYLEFFFPGSLVMLILFSAIFSMMSLIQDRNEGFLLSVLSAPVHRSAIVLGKVLGGATIAAAQGLLFLVFAPFIGIHLGIVQFCLVAGILFLIAFSLTSLGFAIAWGLDSPQAFHAIVNMFLLPMWLLSGALFPVSGASPWIGYVMRANPLTYGVDALRMALDGRHNAEYALSLSASVSILMIFTLVAFAAGFVMVNRRSTTPAA